MSAAPDGPELALGDQWNKVWPEALARWSPYTMLRSPTFFESDEEAKPSGMAGQIAAIRLQDQVVMVNLAEVRRHHLETCALPILAHEIGHHVYVPGNLADNARMIAAMKPVLFGLSADAPGFVANLYGDLLINDRLQRRGGVEIAAIYRSLKADLGNAETTDVWKVYTRTYDYLWRLDADSLAPSGVTPEMDADAALLARLIRHYAGDWLRGARRFACILYPYLVADDQKQRAQTFVVAGLGDARCAGKSADGRDVEGIPDGLTAIDPAEFGDDPEFDRELTDPLGLRPQKPKPRNTAPTVEAPINRNQHREPFEYGELLKALGLNLKEHEITTRYYRERALPHLIPYPTKRAPQTKEPLAEGYETWEPVDDVDNLDLFGSILRSPEIIPGVTTVQRVYGETQGHDPARIPIDIDIYIDCSGSMPNPAVSVSYLALAGTILAMSALRAGAKVQATLWSGPEEFDTTGGFTRDEARILGVVTGYLGGATAFPLHLLRETYRNRKPSDPPAHIVVISDDGADTMLAVDERRTRGASICASALKAARGGGTLVLNLAQSDWPPRERLEKIGFRVHRVTSWNQLVAFARAFVRDNYQ